MPNNLDNPIQSLLVNKAGKPKHRFSYEDKLRILDPTSSLDETEARLEAFQSIFAFRYCNAIITRNGDNPSSWTRLRGFLTLEHTAEHLLGNRIPTKSPVWIGARSFEWVKWLCVDIDADGKSNRSANKPRKQPPPFDERIKQVETAFERIGVNARNRNEVLAVRTPSGGRHYYLFLDNQYNISNLVTLLQDAGLYHKKGEFEFFPSTSHGLRLPFGHIPGQDDRPNAWIKFIDRYRSGRIRRHSLLALSEKFETHLRTSPTTTSNHSKAYHGPTTKTTAQFGNPKAARQDERQQHSPTAATIRSTADARRLWKEGITETGTRTEILMQFAAHLIWFKHVPAAVAAKELTEWAINPRHDSKDIQDDLAHGTDIVAKHIARMCHWYTKNKATKPNSGNSTTTNAAKFTQAELESLRNALNNTPSNGRREQAEFYLRFLHFSKRHGTATPNNQAWQSSPAVRQVIRRWPGCHHMHYKDRINHAIDSGILEITKEKWHRPNGKGRARTYQLNVTPNSTAAVTHTFEMALEFLSR